MNTTRTCIVLAVVAGFGVVSGCGESGPKSYPISGTVNFDGKPIPYGEVIFTPDAAQKNTGPQGIAKIQDGKYDTRWAGGKGVAGGPTVVRVNGMDRPGGKTLCEYELKVDLPREEATHNIEVPKKGAVTGGPGKDI